MVSKEERVSKQQKLDKAEATELRKKVRALQGQCDKLKREQVKVEEEVTRLKAHERPWTARSETKREAAPLIDDKVS